MNDINVKQLEALQMNIENSEPVAVSMHMSQDSLDFITKSLKILDVAKYKKDHGIEIVNKHSSLFKYQCRIIYSDSSSKIINLREEI